MMAVLINLPVGVVAFVVLVMFIIALYDLGQQDK